jgi:heat shock protein HslJ
MRTIVRAVGVLAAVGLIVSSCGADRPDVATAAPLESTPWEVDVSSVAVPGIEQAQPTLSLADGVASGFAGCNTYSGPYRLEGSNLRFGRLATTVMACGPAGSAVETSYLDRLSRVAHYALTRSGLDLEDASGARVLAYVPANTALAGDWRIIGVLLSSGTAFSSVAEPLPTARLSADGTMSGDTGCNTISGPWTQGPDENVKIGPLAATFKACTSPELSTQEASIVEAFNTTTTAEVTSRSAELFNAAGQHTMSLQR